MKSKTQQDYWRNVEIPYVTWYAFEEVLAYFGPDAAQSTSLLSAYKQLTRHVTGDELGELILPETKTKRGT